MPGPRVKGPERAALVGLIAGRARRLEAERSLEELGGLAEAAGAQVVLRMLQDRPKPDPSMADPPARAPAWLKAGDVLEIFSPQIGTLRNTVADEPSA